MLRELIASFGGYIRISSGGEYYPGTEERIIVITGEISQVIDLNKYIMEKLSDPGRDASMKDVLIDKTRTQMTKIVLTHAAAGSLIGKGGASIKSITEDSQAHVSIAMPETGLVPGEQVLTIKGNTEQRTLACKLVIKKVADDMSNMANTKTKYYNTPLDIANSMYTHIDGPTRWDEKPHHRGGTVRLPVKVVAEVKVPVNVVGSILGKQGVTIKDMVHRSKGARMRFDDEKDEDTDTQTLMIKGNMEQCALAYSLVNERVEALNSMSGTYK